MHVITHKHSIMLMQAYFFTCAKAATTKQNPVIASRDAEESSSLVEDLIFVKFERKARSKNIRTCWG